MTARYVVGETRAVTATLPDGSVDFIMTSPPFLALRSYLPADHPDKAHEIGSEATPAAFIDVMLELSAEWRRVLAPHGSIVVELGDTYSGNNESGWERDTGEYRREIRSAASAEGRLANTNRTRAGWPRPKSLTLIPEAYRFALTYGINPHTGQPSPAGRWQVRNVIRWVRPNPPVGALGKKWRPATSDLVVATPDDDKRYWDDVATRTTTVTDLPPAKGNNTKGSDDSSFRFADRINNNPAGAPLLDWWKIVPKGYEGAHYAVYPPELCTAPIDAMCPRRVCRTCGKPSERVTETEYVQTRDGSAPTAMKFAEERRASGVNQWATAGDNGVSADKTTIGWTTCGHPGTDGLRLDGFHDGDGWRPGIVYDPFAGTGTTLSVATGMGRDAIGADLDPRNADLALERVGPLLLSVEHLDPEQTGHMPTEKHNSTGSHPFPRAGWLNWHNGARTPLAKDYGEPA